VTGGRKAVPETIVVAQTPGDYEAFGGLIREYLQWLRDRYAAFPGFIDDVGSHQGLAAELEALPEKYGPPEGKTLLAVREGVVTGGIAYRDLHEGGACEMKRLFVPERFQGLGTGRRLCEELVAAATADGFRVMRLDTGRLNAEALAMYASMGFRDCPPYHDYPEAVLPHLRFLEMPLG
jgi:GNAT superfamily N-acetyltransferase